MMRTMLQAKLHRVTVTGAVLDYEGSCGIEDQLIVCAYSLYTEDMLARHEPRIIFVDAKNRPVSKLG